MKAKHAGILGGVIGILAITVFVLAGGGGYLQSLGGQNPAGSGGGDVTPEIPNVPYEGAITFSAKGSNIGNGTTLTADTNFDVEYFIKSGDTYTKISAETDGGEDLTVGKNDIIYGQVTPPASQNYILDWESTLAANPSGLVKKPSYVDITKDGVIDYLFPLDVSPLKQQGKGNPNIKPTFEWYLKFHGDQVLSLNSPSSQTNVGTGTQSSTITWQATMDHQPGAEPLKAFQITYNGTRATNEVAEEQSFIDFPMASEASGYKRLYLSDPAFQVSEDFTSGSQKTILRYQFGSQIDGANLIVVPAQGSKKVDIDLTLETNMDGANDAVCVELRLEPINARNVAQTALTDDVELAAPSSNTDECSV